MPNVWAVTIEGRMMRIGDFAIEEIDEIATRCGVNWLWVYEHPIRNTQVAKEVIEAVAKKLGVAVPILVRARDLYNAFEQVPDDLPAEYSDGIPKEAPAATETTG
jgi:hypothetical protein